MSPRFKENSNNLSYRDIVMSNKNTENNQKPSNISTDNNNSTNEIIIGGTEFNTMDLIPQRLKNELLEKGLLIVNVPQDGNCMFHAISSHLPGVTHYNLRQATVWYLKQKRSMMIEYLGKTYEEIFKDQDDSFNKNWDKFLEYIETDGNWEKTPAEYILKIISELYNLEINIYSTLSCNKQEIVGWNYDYFNLRKNYLIHMAEMHWCTTYKTHVIPQKNNDTPSYIS